MEDEKSALPCADKLVFEDKKTAEAAAAALKYQKGTELKSYQCRYCHLWHLSSNSGE